MILLDGLHEEGWNDGEILWAGHLLLEYATYGKGTKLLS